MRWLTCYSDISPIIWHSSCSLMVLNRDSAPTSDAKVIGFTWPNSATQHWLSQDSRAHTHARTHTHKYKNTCPQGMLTASTSCARNLPLLQAPPRIGEWANMLKKCAHAHTHTHAHTRKHKYSLHWRKMICFPAWASSKWHSQSQDWWTHNKISFHLKLS